MGFQGLFSIVNTVNVRKLCDVLYLLSISMAAIDFYLKPSS